MPLALGLVFHGVFSLFCQDTLTPTLSLASEGEGEDGSVAKIKIHLPSFASAESPASPGGSAASSIASAVSSGGGASPSGISTRNWPGGGATVNQSRHLGQQDRPPGSADGTMM
ncbi:MAG: hypothetical protein BIFFINMI_03083 [Phycisphaerae bacterium]|nr:hypothetical protein [Phycisphaerae bacterium]